MFHTAPTTNYEMSQKAFLEDNFNGSRLYNNFTIKTLRGVSTEL